MGKPPRISVETPVLTCPELELYRGNRYMCPGTEIGWRGKSRPMLIPVYNLHD